MKQLRDSGLNCTTEREEGIDCLCISNDTELTFKKLEDACILLGEGVDYIATNAMKATGFSKEETALMGDRLYTDIACGVNAQISTIFVLSGEGTLQDVENSDIKPEFVYKNIREIYNDLVK